MADYVSRVTFTLNVFCCCLFLNKIHWLRTGKCWSKCIVVHCTSAVRETRPLWLFLFPLGVEICAWGHDKTHPPHHPPHTRPAVWFCGSISTILNMYKKCSRPRDRNCHCFLLMNNVHRPSFYLIFFSTIDCGTQEDIKYGYCIWLLQ